MTDTGGKNINPQVTQICAYIWHDFWCAPCVERLNDFGKVSQAAREAIDFINDDGVDLFSRNVIQQMLELPGSTGISAVIVPPGGFANLHVPGPSNFALVISKRLKIQSFIATDYSSKVKEMVSNYSGGTAQAR